MKPKKIPLSKILVVEDEEAIREMLAMALEHASFDVELTADASEAQKAIERQVPDLILLDWMLPGISGVEWARRIKTDESFRDIPIILVTARGEEEDTVRGFEVGADDYVTKPFSLRELVARMKAILRRVDKSGAQSKIEFDGIVLDADEHRLTIDANPVELSPTEYRLIAFFISHSDKVYSRNQLLDQVWGRSAYIEERTVDVHIRRLRKILADYGKEDLIQTVRGFGYRFSNQH